MNKKRSLLWLIPLILLLLMIPFIVPSALPWAGAENLPDYEPVELANPNPGPVPTKPGAWGNNRNKTLDKVLYKPHKNAYFTDEDGVRGYLDGTLSVRIYERTIQGTKVFFTWVQIADPSQLRAQFANPYPSPGSIYAHKLAEREDAVLTLNGDYCVGAKGGAGVVYRNGEEFRKVAAERYDQLIIDREGDFHILLRPSLKDFEPYEGNILHSFIFGPALVVDGVLQDIGSDRDYGYNMTFNKKAQRQAICQMDKLSYLIVTTEGPSQSAKGGFTMYDFAQLVYDCGVVNAYSLDGGASTWLLLGTERISNAKGRNLRPITDIVYFVTAEPMPEKTPEPEPDSEEVP